MCTLWESTYGPTGKAPTGIFLYRPRPRKSLNLYMPISLLDYVGWLFLPDPSDHARCSQPDHGNRQHRSHPTRACRTRYQIENFLDAKASLEDVSGVATCRRADIDGQVITGIVLRYTDKTEASRDWVAPDGLDSPIAVPDSGIWHYVALSRTGFPIVTSRAFIFTALTREDNAYLRLRWRGELEWWFSPRQCQLYYNSKLTAETKLYFSLV